MAGTFAGTGDQWHDFLLGGAAQNCWSLLLDLAMAKRRIAERRAATSAPTAPKA